MKSIVALCLVLLVALVHNGEAQVVCEGSDVRQCSLDCLEVREMDSARCLECDEDCNMDSSEEREEDQPTCETDATCDANHRCAESISDGSDRCVAVPTAGMDCVNDLLEERAEDESTDEYFDSGRLELDREAIPCATGSVCEGDEESSVCTNFTGPGQCRTDQASDSSVRCRVDGQFRPVQCNADRTSCWCVFPNGTIAADSMVRNGIPDCRKYYRGCDYTLTGDLRPTTFRPGSFVNQYQSDNCFSCYCYFDTWRCNTDVILPREQCGIRDTPARNCSFLNDDGEREMLAHGMRTRGRCNSTCGCDDGTLICTTLRCDDDDDDDECGRCDSQEVFSPVCGNGIEYKSSCHAMRCGGLTAGEFTDGLCTDDPCTATPCPDRHICRPTPTKCLRREGCAELQRECVAIDSLHCILRTTDDRVCGTDGQTYTSLCEMLRMRLGAVQLRYNSPCDDPECTDRTVCDSDGETLESECDATERGSRVEYDGSCEDREDSDSYDTYCDRVRNSRCRSLERCGDRIAQPLTGCCRVCGGVLTARLNEDTLNGFSAVDQMDLLEASGFGKSLVANTFLSDLLSVSRCRMDVDVTDTRGEIEFIFSDREMTDPARAGRMCHDIANMLECLMNNRTRPTRENCRVDTDIIDSIPDDYMVNEDATLSAVTAATSSPVSSLSGSAQGGLAVALATVCIAVFSALYAVW